MLPAVHALAPALTDAAELVTGSGLTRSADRPIATTAAAQHRPSSPEPAPPRTPCPVPSRPAMRQRSSTASSPRAPRVPQRVADRRATHHELGPVACRGRGLHMTRADPLAQRVVACREPARDERAGHQRRPPPPRRTGAPRPPRRVHAGRPTARTGSDRFGLGGCKAQWLRQDRIAWDLRADATMVLALSLAVLRPGGRAHGRRRGRHRLAVNPADLRPGGCQRTLKPTGRTWPPTTPCGWRRSTPTTGSC